MRQVAAALPTSGATAAQLIPLFHGKTRKQIDRALQRACECGLAFRLVSGSGRGNNTVYAPNTTKWKDVKNVGAASSVFDYAQKLGVLN